MLTPKLVRWSGVAAILGGMLWIATLAITAMKPEHSRRGPGGFIVLLLAGLVLIAFGMVGIYVRQRGRSGWLGTLAPVVAGVGIAVTILGRVAVDVGLVPAIVFQAGLLTFIIGLLLFIISIFLANVLPRSAAFLLVIGTLALVVFNFGDERIWIGVLFGAAWIWLGYALWSGSGER
jgi:hypothetical protein